MSGIDEGSRHLDKNFVVPVLFYVPGRSAPSGKAVSMSERQQVPYLEFSAYAEQALIWICIPI